MRSEVDVEPNCPGCENGHWRLLHPYTPPRTVTPLVVRLRCDSCGLEHNGLLYADEHVSVLPAPLDGGNPDA